MNEGGPPDTGDGANLFSSRGRACDPNRSGQNDLPVGNLALIIHGDLFDQCAQDGAMTQQQHLSRAARAMLNNMTQAELARRAGVGLGTLVSYEAGTRATSPELVARIRSALEAAGVIFRADGSITTAQQILDHFAQLRSPTAAQKAEAVVAAQRLALAGGRQESPTDFAIAVIRADRKRRGLED